MERVRRWREVRLSRGQALCLVAAVVLLGWSAWLEGAQPALAGLHWFYA